MRKAQALLVLILLLALVPAQALAADWTAVRKDAQHTSHADETLTPPLAPAWVSNAGGNVIGSPVIVGDTVYYTNGEGASLIAADLATGRAKWAFQAISTVEGSPTVANDSVIFGSYDRSQGSKDSQIYRVKASDGSLVWKTQLGSGMYSSPLVYSDHVYVGTDNSDFYALDLATGHIVWQLTGNTTQGSPAGDRGKVYIGMYDGHVYALDALTGKVAWAYDTKSPIHSSPAIFDGKVFIATRGGTLYAFDEDTGAVQWTANLGYKADATPSVDPATGMIFIGTYGGYVKAFSASNGTAIWTSGFQKPIYATAAVSGDAVYGVSQDGWLFALNRTDGSGLWGIDVGGAAFSSPAVANGYLVIGTLAKQLIAFKATAGAGAPTAVAPPTPTPYVAPTPLSSALDTRASQVPFPGFVAVLGAIGVAYLLVRRR